MSSKVLELEFKDRILDKLETNFIDENNKTQEHVRYKFPDCKGRSCQGLILIHKRKSKRKKMNLEYFVNGKNKRLYLGDYHRENFNVSKIEKRISELRAEYGGIGLTWAIDIQDGELLKKKQKYNQIHEELQKSIVNDAVKSFFENSCPSVKHPSETLNRDTAREYARSLIGYDERIDALVFERDKFNQCKISFKADSGIETWQQYWSKYPPREYQKDEPKKSMFDTPIGQRILSDLTEEDLRAYINKMSNSLGTQRKIREAFSAVWANAKIKSLVGKNSSGFVPPNPVAEIKIERPKESIFSHFDTEEFKQDEINKIYHACMKLRNEYIFQTQNILLQMFTGRRKENLLQLKWSMITFKKMVVESDGKRFEVFGVIEMPKEITKTKKPDKIWITKNVKDVLLDLHKQRTENHWAMFIDWCFPSPRVQDKQFLMKGNENNTEKARLKDVIGCFRSIVKVSGILRPVAMKMFRTTHENKVNESKMVRSTWDVVSVTGRTDTKSSEQSYLNKKLTGNVAAIVNDVDEEFSKIISIAGKK